MSKHAIVTGAAGFIGSHLTGHLLEEGWAVTAIDNFDPFYDPVIKRLNIVPFQDYSQFNLIEADIRDPALDKKLSRDCDLIVHLAAKAGVRPSIRDPAGYQDVNVQGTQALLELARRRGIRQFVFASSSSVYGVNPNVPWREDDHVLLPISPYASTKVSGELMGHVYSHLYGIRFLALRFFTVFGPGQRPDLAIHKFARLMLQGDPVPLYGDGLTSRDYTYVGDIVDGVRAAMEYDSTAYEIINLGNDRGVTLKEMLAVLEERLGVRAIVQSFPEQPGDVRITRADIRKARTMLGYNPRTDFREGIRRFVQWLTCEHGKQAACSHLTAHVHHSEISGS